MGATEEIDFKQMAKNILAAYQRDIDQGYEPSPCGKQVQIIAQAYLDQCQEVERLRLQVQYLAQIARIVEKAKAIRTNNE